MRFKVLPAALVLVASLVHAQDGGVLSLGSRREVLADRYLIDTMSGLSHRLELPRDEGPVLKLDQPWEGKFSAYFTVLKDGDTYRLYYRGMPGIDPKDRRGAEATCYAESRDGIHWKRPKLGLVEHAGSKDNNILLRISGPSHNFCPFIDPRKGIPAEQRYKALAGLPPSAFVSADGIHWTKLADKVITKGAFDSQNVPFWSESEQRYVCYLRVFVDKVRQVARAESKDFVTWTDPVLMETGKPLEHLYTNQTHPYFRAPHLYVSLAARFFPGRQVITPEEAKAIQVEDKYFKDCSDAVLMTSRGGNVYDRTFREGFVVPGIGPENWVSRTNYPALNVVQTGPHEMSFYVNQNYGQPTAHLRRYSLRLDGFASVQATAAPGEMVTKPLTFTGKELTLNFATSAAGGIRVEIQDAAGQTIPGYTLADAVETIGNEIERVVRWKTGSDVSQLTGRPIRLRFAMKDARLFALRFRD
jgi:hypothetical protein